MIDQGFADSPVAHQCLGQAGRHVTEARDRAVKDGLAGEGGERCLFRWLPDDGVAADEGKRRIPRPDGNREVEGGNDADNAEGMPGF
ncbi:hypothetical protein LXJ58_31865, partial [Escherichia coli]|nr:hypothetical protein [Escherichia coli]